MTTTPKVTKYRIRRDSLAAGSPSSVSAAPASKPAVAPVQAPRATTPPPGPGSSGRVSRNGVRNAASALAGDLAQSRAEAAGAPSTASAARAEFERRPESLFEEHDDGFGNQRFAQAAKGDGDTVLGPKELTVDEEIAKIRAEGLTGRQLRLARRMAQKHGIQATSDFEAVRLLRQKGIDPLDRSNILSMVKGDAEDDANLPATTGGRTLARIDGKGADPNVQLPQTVKGGKLPSTELMNEDTRARDIMNIQRDIARRRRRKIGLLITRLAFFVFLPTLAAAYYYYVMATPMYATKTEFVIQKADGLGGAGMSSLFSGTQLATNQDSVTVQSYLQSRDAMLRLDADQGFKAQFQQDFIDPLQRLDPDASNERAYKLYKRNVKIGYDPSEGVVKMEVVAPEPEESKNFSEALISYAEEQVDQLTSRLREDQMKGARESYADAERKVFDAQSKVLTLQEQVGIIDPVSESSLVMSQVSAFETQLQQKRLELGQLQDNTRPNAARVAGVQGDIARLETLISNLRSQLTQRTSDTASLASVTGDLRIAEAELQTRQLLLSQAAQQMETARIEANKQVRYLEMGVRPVAPDEPTYPRSFENTLVAFLIFSGIYLMLSLTASILREQVSS
ncbi:capsule biosynthesis protein [Thioclava sp. SK-1]|uniref:capsule biosynthesis protein n=1 Tax=Thioclava sp. SK-1 TaxID=1889770 RepID=UPI000825855E|nr:capsule biosynthesis protein [Thioclava sp. SK-1]OCX65363.1 capsule biosynthesis protein [Thioclava sp. SK-1]